MDTGDEFLTTSSSSKNSASESEALLEDNLSDGNEQENNESDGDGGNQLDVADDMIDEIFTPPRTPSSPPIHQPPEFLATSLLGKDGSFGYLWLIAHGELDQPIKRRSHWTRIMAVDSDVMWENISRYMPSLEFECSDANSIFQVLKVETLMEGLLKLSSWQLERIISRSKKTFAEMRKLRRFGNLPDDDEEGDAEPTVRQPSRGRRRRKSTKSRKEAPPHEASPDVEENVVEVEEPKQRRKRRVNPEPIPSDADILRLLTTRASELQLIGDKNLLLEPGVAEPLVTSLGSFYDELPEGQPVQQQLEFLMSFQEEDGETTTVAEVPGLIAQENETNEERNEARAISRRSPNAYAQPAVPPSVVSATVSSAEAEDDSFPPLADAVPVVSAPRRRRRRALVFTDVLKELPREEFMANLRADTTEALINQAREKMYASLWRDTKLKGLIFIESSGVRLIGLRLKETMDKIRTQMPIRDRDEIGEQEGIRAEISPRATSLSGLPPVSHISQGSALVGQVTLEATTSRHADAEIRRDISPVPSATTFAAAPAEEIEFSIRQTPPRPSPSSHGDMNGRPMSPTGLGGGLDDVASSVFEPQRNPSVPEKEVLTFDNVVPQTTSRLAAARMFLGMLKHQAHKNVQLTQDVPYGRIQIQVLNSQIDPSQYEDSFLKD